MSMGQLLVLLSLAAFGLGSHCARSQSVAMADAPQKCTALANVDFAGIDDAPTQLSVADSTPGGDGAPAYCHVKGYVAPGVGIELGLPVAWNGKFIEVGCGGFCGSTHFFGNCASLIRRGYACVSSNMGLESTSHQALWAYNNLQAEIDHG
jgi:Tannase and feruloyl esterase